MERFQRFIAELYDRKITQDYDRIIPVVGDESVGKSTLILQGIWIYEDYRGLDPDPASVLDAVIFDSKEAFRQRMLNADSGDPVAAMDAAHILYRKDAMDPDQKQVEKTLLDIRIKNYLIFLGYQDWADIPDQLQRRRAKHLIHIPKRGVMHGYSRKQLDEKYSNYNKNEWPKPAMKDSFTSLEGTDLWARFQEIDEERKKSRLQLEEEKEEETRPQDVVNEILIDGVGQYIDVNEYQDRAYFSKPLIRYDYPELSDQQADQVRAALNREVDIEDHLGEGTDTPPPSVEG